MKRKTIGAALMLLMTSGAAYAGTCEDQMAAYNKHVAEDKAEASKWAPGVKEANDKFNEQMKANILKGCEPGGFFEQVDEAIRNVKAECAAHPNKQGC